MDTIKSIASYMINNPAVIIMLGLILARALGYERQYMRVLQAVQFTIDTIHRDMAEINLEIRNITGTQRITVVNNALAGLTDRSPLTYPQAAAVLNRDPDTGKYEVNKKALAVELLKSSPGKEVQREFRDGVQWLKNRAAGLFK